MSQQVNVAEIVQNLRNTAQQMINLAMLMENAEELESIQAKLNQLLGNPMLAQAVTALTGQPAMPVPVIAPPTQPAPTTPQTGYVPPASAQTPVTPAPVPPAPVQPPVTPTPVPPAPVQPPVTPTPVPPAVTQAPQQTEAPAAGPKERPYRDKIMEQYTLLGVDMTMMASPVDDWAEAKAKTVLDNPEIHPDSVTSFGTVNSRPWTWDEVMTVAKNVHTKSFANMTLYVNHNANEIKNMVEALKLNQRNVETPAQKSQPKNEPETKSNNDTLNLEQYLPDEIQNPNPAKRLKIFKLMSDTTYDEISELTGIRKKTLLKLENGSTAMSTNYQSKLTNAIGLDSNAFTTMPITDILDLSHAKEAKNRLQMLRLRFGMSEQEFANRTSTPEPEYLLYETKGIAKSEARRICATLKVDFGVFRDLYPEETKQAAEHKSTAEKLRALRIKNKQTIYMLANKTGLSASYISSLENGQHNPSETALSKLALALNCTINDIVGDPNLNIKPLKTT